MRQFKGKWISNEILSQLQPRNVFHRQLEKQVLDCSEHRNQHVLFRKTFNLTDDFQNAKIYITADDYYKLYINGRFVAQGPAPSYHFQYNYNEIDISEYLTEGENLIAVHTLYQGLINRVWQSGDQRHGLLCDLVIDGETVVSSDESFLVSLHTGYTETGICGYQTQFLERYDSRAAEVGFERPDFDDGAWANACVCVFDDHITRPQQSKMLAFEAIAPKSITQSGNKLLYDFGACYVGYLSVTARGKDGDVVVVRCGQELTDEGAVRFALRANCNYEEEWVLANGESALDWFDYKAFRYAELEIPESVEILQACFHVRHYPFALSAALSPAYATDPDVQRIWALCVHTQQYGVQEVIQDCMEREKGFYLGDGCYTALTHMVLTGDDSMARKLIDDAFSTAFITDTLVTCMDCSFMQEIAEYPLILVYLVLWHYRYTHDIAYLRTNYAKVTQLLDAFRREYEHQGLLKELDKWCVVEWPKNFQQGYGVDIREGQICHEAHISINAYYIYAIRTANEIAKILQIAPYRDDAPLYKAFLDAFYDPEKNIFRDGENTDHVTLVGNSFAYAFDLCPCDEAKQSILAMLDEMGMDSLSLFCTFPMLMGLLRDGDEARIRAAILNEGTWKRMLREGATTTFEGWGKDTKKNASLFHLTMSYIAPFLADIDLGSILFGEDQS